MANEFFIGITQHIISLSAFLGGFSATFLAAILVVEPKKQFSNWLVVLSAISACSFVACACSSIALVNALQVPYVDLNAGNVKMIRLSKLVSHATLSVGLFSLLASIGVSGWLRNKNVGIVTSSAAAIATIIVWVML